MKYLNKTVKTVFMILGKGCNFHCRYCMQHDTKQNHVVYPTEINEDIFEFIEEISENQKDKFYVHFYGGEPLLYKDKLKYITNRLSHLNNVLFSVVTNGSLIDEDMVQFFNDHNFAVNISWDGNFSTYTRGKNVFQTNRKNLFAINNLGVAAVISAATPLDKLLEDIQNLVNEHREQTGYGIRIIFDEIFDFNIEDKELLDIDYDKIADISRAIAKECIAIKSGKLLITDEEFCTKFYAKTAFFDRIYNRINLYFKNQEQDINYMVNCCNGISVLNLDLEGNLYSCHNCDTKVGNIYSDLAIYLDRLVKSDEIKYFYHKYCKDCFVYSMCHGGCKLIGEEARNQSYCKLRKAIFTPAIEEIINAIS